MTDTAPAPLPPETLVTVANLAQAVAQIAASLPSVVDAKPGELSTNNGILTVMLKD